MYCFHSKLSFIFQRLSVTLNLTLMSILTISIPINFYELKMLDFSLDENILRSPICIRLFYYKLVLPLTCVFVI